MIFNGFATPILITCRDRVEPLQQLVSWLETAGYQRIVLVDNDLSYDPLRSYYADTPHQVLRLGRNLGHLAVWEAGVLGTLEHNGPFVVTDCDVVPDQRTPHDAVDHFADLLFRYSDVDKVGFGLRIDDLPNSYQFRDDVITWESQFWEDEVESGVYRAELDTTFALYRPTSPKGSLRALRTGPPYVARHLPWYGDSNDPSEEDTYYEAHMTPGVSNWNLRELPKWLQQAIATRRGLNAPRRSSSSGDRGPSPTVAIRVSGIETPINFVRTDQEGGFWDLFAAGRWAPETVSLIVALTKPGITFVDVGAWIGPLSIIAAKRGASVVALEPDPVAVDVFRANLSLNPDIAQCVTLEPVALGKRTGSSFIPSAQLGETSGVVHGGAKPAQVKTVRTGDWSRTSSLLAADILRIDIEGAEFSVVPRLHRALRRHRPTLLLSVDGHHFVGRYPLLPRRVRWATQHVISLVGRVRILLALRNYKDGWQWDKRLARWQVLSLQRSCAFVKSLADTELVFSDTDLPPVGVTGPRSLVHPL